MYVCIYSCTQHQHTVVRGGDSAGQDVRQIHMCVDVHACTLSPCTLSAHVHAVVHGGDSAGQDVTCAWMCMHVKSMYMDLT